MADNCEASDRRVLDGREPYKTGYGDARRPAAVSFSQNQVLYSMQERVHVWCLRSLSRRGSFWIVLDGGMPSSTMLGRDRRQ
jgi:hypothetical protein